jgi:hypothetical protein
MSYASFTKSFPDLIKSVPEKLTQPTSIAVMASVGIHALLGVTLPYFNQVVKQPQSSTPMRELLGIPSSDTTLAPNISATATPPGTPVGDGNSASGSRSI